MPDRPIRLLSTFAVASAVKALLPEFERRTGARVDADYSTTKLMMERLTAGETADLVIVTDDAADALAEKGAIADGGRTEIVMARIGIAHAADQSPPAAANLDEFIATLRAAPAISYSRAGVSGLYFAGLIEKLGIAEWVNAKSIVIPVGFTGEKLMNGEVTVAIQMISELRSAGVTNIVPLPDEIQLPTRFATVVMRTAAVPEGAADLAAYLASPEAMEVYRNWGLETLR